MDTPALEAVICKCICGITNPTACLNTCSFCIEEATLFVSLICQKINENLGPLNHLKWLVRVLTGHISPMHNTV